MRANIASAKTYLVLLASLPAVIEAHSGYIGYSGAPGTYGLCASSCHGSGTQSITVSGFPSSYIPGQQYEITITSPSAVRNFNGSIRQGTGSNNAGTISAGTGTATYNDPVETNGVHLSSYNQTSFSFFWTAPVTGTGDVRLYLALHWGSSSGPNLDTVLVASESVGVSEGESGLHEGLFPTERPGVFLLRLNPSQDYRTVRAFDPSGRLILTLMFPPDETEALVDLSPESLGTYLIQVGENKLFKAIRR